MPPRRSLDGLDAKLYALSAADRSFYSSLNITMPSIKLDNITSINIDIPPPDMTELQEQIRTYINSLNARYFGDYPDYLGEWSYNDSNSVDAPIQNDIKRNPSPYEWYFRNGLDARVFITDEVNLPKCHEESLISFDDAMGFGGVDGV